MRQLTSTFGYCAIQILVLEAVFRIIAAVEVPSVLCKEPVLTTVAVDEPAHRFYPYFIQLHQCQGSWNHESPNIKQCVATGYKEIKLTVRFTTSDWKSTEITVRNHTSCGPQCKASDDDCDFRVQRWNDQSCTCECLYKASPPPENVIRRKEGFRWNKNLCRYKCNRPYAVCPVKKTWSREKCGCVCHYRYKLNCEDDNKHMDSKTCECKDPHHFLVEGKRPGFFTYFESKILVAFLVFAILVILGLIARLIYLGRKSKPQTEKSGGLDVSDAGSDCPSQATFESAV